LPIERLISRDPQKKDFEKIFYRRKLLRKPLKGKIKAT